MESRVVLARQLHSMVVYRYSTTNILSVSLPHLCSCKSIIYVSFSLLQLRHRSGILANKYYLHSSLIYSP